MVPVCTTRRMPTRVLAVLAHRRLVLMSRMLFMRRCIVAPSMQEVPEMAMSVAVVEMPARMGQHQAHIMLKAIQRGHQRRGRRLVLLAVCIHTAKNWRGSPWRRRVLSRPSLTRHLAQIFHRTSLRSRVRVTCRVCRAHGLEVLRLLLVERMVCNLRQRRVPHRLPTARTRQTMRHHRRRQMPMRHRYVIRFERVMLSAIFFLLDIGSKSMCALEMMFVCACLCSSSW